MHQDSNLHYYGHSAPFANTAEMLAYAEANPQATRKEWWRFYTIKCKTDLHSRLIDSISEQSSAVFLVSDRFDMVRSCSKSVLSKTYKPIPCPHFFTRVRIDFLLHSTGKSVTKQPHTEIFCVNDAWKLSENEFYHHLSCWCSESIHNTWITMEEDNPQLPMTLRDEIEFVTGAVLPIVKNSYLEFVEEHKTRGLLNKELFK